MKLLRRMSLAARLALLFFGVTAIVFSIAGIHLYRSLNEQLQHHDDLALLGTVEIVRDQLARGGGMESVHALINLMHAAYGPHAAMFAIWDTDGTLLAASSPDAERLPSDSPIAAEYSPDVRDIRDWIEGGEKKGRMVVAWERTPGVSGDRVILTMAREAANRGMVLDAHGHDVLLTLVLGILATALLGYAVARHGLQPIEEIARVADHLTASELTERLSFENTPPELQKMVHAFNGMLDRLEDSFHRLSQFSSDIAHELRTPISNLMVETQVALTKVRTIPEYEALLASNIEELERLSRMIQDMLFLAKADNPETVIETAPIDLRGELDKVVDFCGTLMEERRLSLVRHGSARVEADKNLLQRAIHNMLVNAIRYSMPGGTIEATIVSRDDGFVEFSVTNPGPGIPSEHLPHVFDRFYRVDSAREKSAEGVGLGLAIVKSIARLHKGGVTVTSTVNDRTTFTLRLRAA